MTAQLCCCLHMMAIHKLQDSSSPSARSKALQHRSTASGILSAGVDEALHLRDVVRREAAASGMLSNELLVRGYVDAEQLVLANCIRGRQTSGHSNRLRSRPTIAMHPVHALHRPQNIARLVGDILQLSRSQFASPCSAIRKGPSRSKEVQTNAQNYQHTYSPGMLLSIKYFGI